MSYLGQQLVVLFCCSVSTVQLADRLMRILGCRLCPGTTRERDGVCVCVCGLVGKGISSQAVLQLHQEAPPRVCMCCSHTPSPRVLA